MAYHLAMVQDDDIPLIPESSGLELADEGDIADIIGFIDVDESSRDGGEELGFLEPEDAIEELHGEVEEDQAAKQAMAEAEIRESGLEPLEEVDFELLLSSIDLSSLEQWDRGPAGAAEADATRAPSAAARPAEVPSREEDHPLDLGSPIDDRILPEAAAVEGSLEALESETPDIGPAATIERYLGPWIAYRPFAAVEGGPAVGELPVVGEGEAWSEPEFLGELSPSGLSDDESDEALFDGPYEDGIIEYRDGVFKLNTELAASSAESSDLGDRDPELRALVDSVLGDPSSPPSA